MKEILLASDLSSSSESALARAIGLAAQLNARLAVLHVVDGGLPQEVAEGLRQRADALLRAQLAAEPAAAGQDISVEVAIGEAFAEILNRAGGRSSDLIVMGVHRKGPLMDLFRGTTVERVLRRGDRPTLVVRKRSGEPYRRVLVAVDFSIGARRALEVALRLTPGGEIFVLHAYDVPFQAFLTDPRTKQEVKAEQDQRLSKLVDAEMNAFLEQSGDARRKCRAILAQKNRST